MVDNPGRMTYNPMYEPIDKNVFNFSGLDSEKWKVLYPGAQEIMPRRINDILGKSVVIKADVDDKYA